MKIWTASNGSNGPAPAGFLHWSPWKLIRNPRSCIFSSILKEFASFFDLLLLSFNDSWCNLCGVKVSGFVCPPPSTTTTKCFRRLDADQECCTFLLKPKPIKAAFQYIWRSNLQQSFKPAVGGLRTCSQGADSATGGWLLTLFPSVPGLVNVDTVKGGASF